VKALLPALAAVLVLGGCASGGGGGGSSTGPSGPPVVTRLPTSGTVRYKGDGRIYTIAPLAHALRLDDIDVQVRGVAYRRSVAVAFKPPGTKTFAVVTLTITNDSKKRETVGPTQIWLRNADGFPYLAAQTTGTPKTLLTTPIPAGGSVTGDLVFPVPQQETGYLLVYRFADAGAIAKAKRVGLVKYG
jgi:Domain of unknown function (DUF4352)